LTIESGVKVYEWFYDGESESVTLSQEEYDNIVDADIVVVNMGGALSCVVNKSGKELAEAIGYYALTGQFEIQGSRMLIDISINISTKLATIALTEQEIPTKTSQLENDSNFVSSDNLKTINGESIVGSGDITVAKIENVGDTPCLENAAAICNPINGMVYGLPGSEATGDSDDYLLSAGTVKTINGQPIVGRGDIEISGGSSSGAYAEVNHGTSDTIFTLTPNTFHVWDEVASLTLTLGSETAGVANEYLFQFTSGATATTLSLPSDLKWANDSAPTIVENMIYQMSILKGFASVLEFKKTVIISFSINGNPYQAEYGMTWKNFVDSPYNDGKVILNGSLCFYNGIPIFNSSMSSVESSQYIEANANYTATQGSGGA
jgi:hypothetical protein